VVRTPGGAAAALAGLVATLAVTAAACSSASGAAPGSSPSPRQSVFAARSIDSAALLAQCALTLPVATVVTSARKANQALPAAQRWLSGHRLVLTQANGGQFDAWFEDQAAGVVVRGTSLGNWERYAGTNDRLPAAVCGSGVSPRGLHRQIYAHDPTMLKNNPWGS
jgi:hypothetical protein